MELSGNIYKILASKSERKELLEGLGLHEDNIKIYLEELGFEVVNEIDVRAVEKTVLLYDGLNDGEGIDQLGD